ncbi:aldose 1-epimerase family protein [Bacillus safensis]|uniref:aldose 1-epimerase family protein n=1 Tax=Bacillus safensis TaxID=561879 RepID=UPI00227F51CE|nr:aldose 1-epimerase family protein [Bacillus safensis]MCY7708146.1 aldose 1-epimerase family protein [Bacillus safensis]MCY7728778.1 aldose 1-epimerase family protein [Bacillus safensis]MED0882369.1 aldose 1-epimerase family protein [Bacillus safensis]MED0917655.1 aldose 1-epimerase family protein [Bacillus safensis]
MRTIENDQLLVQIHEKGAEVREVLDKKSGRHYMWSGDPAYWGRVSPVLFPIVGRLMNDQYKMDDQTFELTQHGFLRDVNFDLYEETEHTVTFQYESRSRHMKQYPYEFTARIRYELLENGLKISWEIDHDGDDTMYFSIGGHPAFRVPLVEGEQAADYSLTLTPSTEHLPVQYELRNSLVREKGKGIELEPIQLQPELFQHDAMIFSHINRVSLTSRAGHGVEVDLTGFPFVGIWSPYDQEKGTMAPFVCIEPWYGIADMEGTNGQYKEKFGIQTLEKNETFHAAYTVFFK